MKRTAFALALAAASLSLAGCGGSETASEAEAGMPLTAGDARLILPPVAGNPAAVYFTVRNGGTMPVTLRGVSVAGAQSAELHSSMDYAGQTFMEQIPQMNIEAGQSATFEPGANHVMVNGLPETAEAGGQVEVTLNFLGGKTFAFPARIEEAGADR